MSAVGNLFNRFNFFNPFNLAFLSRRVAARQERGAAVEDVEEEQERGEEVEEGRELEGDGFAREERPDRGRIGEALPAGEVGERFEERLARAVRVRRVFRRIRQARRRERPRRARGGVGEDGQDRVAAVQRNRRGEAVGRGPFERNALGVRAAGGGGSENGQVESGKGKG